MPETIANKEFIKPESFRDRLATVDAKGKRKWIFAKKPQGKLYRYRTWMSWLFFALFFSLPFITINGRPLFQFNVLQARFIVFGQIFWPQDFFIFGLTMITFVVFIILFTASFGRLFCGWVCPQTVFMEMLFRKVEYLFEGDANKQKYLRKQPWNTEKILRKSGKHVAFFILSFIIANFFLSYIIGMKELEKIIADPISTHAGGFLSILAFSGIFYGVYAFFREQVCTVVCPYGRLQGVLLDKNSMIVAYDYLRGEPRSRAKKKDPAIAAGECIDCSQCVDVCPTGIDIRNGTQMECIGCTACIDACNRIMERTGGHPNLIRYASEYGITNKEPLHFTTRMKLYTALLSILVLLLVSLLLTRKDVDATVMRTPGMLYQERGKDSISNLYNIKLVNKTLKEVPLTIRMEEGSGDVQIIGHHISVKAEGQGSGSFFLVLPRSTIHERKKQVKLGLYNGNEKIDVVKTNFLGPVTN